MNLPTMNTAVGPQDPSRFGLEPYALQVVVGDDSIKPSSILPLLAISGVYTRPDQVVVGHSTGYTDYLEKYLLLQQGKGLFTGNFFDYRQDRDFNQGFLVEEYKAGKPLNGFLGKGINKRYTSPESYRYGNVGDKLFGPSGLFISYPPAYNYKTGYTDSSTHPEYSTYNGSAGTGLFNFKGFLSNLNRFGDSQVNTAEPRLNGHASNAVQSKLITGAAGIDDFSIFNPYVHHLPFDEENVRPMPIPQIRGQNDIVVHQNFVADLVPTTALWDRYAKKDDDNGE